MAVGERQTNAPVTEALSASEEAELARRYQAGDTGAGERLVHSQRNAVLAAARAYRRLGAPMGDLVQEGMIGLLKAAERYNPDSDARLASYARSWIRSAMQEHAVRYGQIVRTGTSSAHRALFLRLKKLGASMGENAATLRDACDQQSEALARDLAQRFQVSVAEVRATAARAFGTDSALDSDPAGGDALASDLPDPESATVAQHSRQQLRHLVDRLLAGLPDREALILRRRYLEREAAATFEQLGRELGVSKDRARQLEQRGLAMLRQGLPDSAALRDLLGGAQAA